MLESATGRWVAYLRLEDPPGLSPVVTVGRFDTVEAAQLATEEVWGSEMTRCGGRSATPWNPIFPRC